MKLLWLLVAAQYFTLVFPPTEEVDWKECEQTEMSRKNEDGLWTSETCVNILKSGAHKFTLLIYVQCSWVWVFVHFIICDWNSPGLDPHMLFLCSSTLTLWGLYTLSHPHTRVSNPWIYKAALKIKFLLLIIFLVIRKYTCSQKEECSDAGRLLTSTSSVSLMLSCFAVCALFFPLNFIFLVLWPMYFVDTSTILVNLMNIFFHVNDLYLTFLSHIILLFYVGVFLFLFSPTLF